MELAGHELSTDIIRALQIRYPLANVERELLLAKLWLEKNPASRPKRPLRFVENWLKKCSPKTPLLDLKRVKWWETEAQTLEMGKSVGLAPRGHETWAEFRARISDKLSERKAG
jgi:hypothetical protein